MSAQVQREREEEDDSMAPPEQESVHESVADITEWLTENMERIKKQRLSKNMETKLLKALTKSADLRTKAALLRDKSALKALKAAEKTAKLTKKAEGGEGKAAPWKDELTHLYETYDRFQDAHAVVKSAILWGYPTAAGYRSAGNGSGNVDTLKGLKSRKFMDNAGNRLLLVNNNGKGQIYIEDAESPPDLDPQEEEAGEEGEEEGEEEEANEEAQNPKKKHKHVQPQETQEATKAHTNTTAPKLVHDAKAKGASKKKGVTPADAPADAAFTQDELACKQLKAAKLGVQHLQECPELKVLVSVCIRSYQHCIRHVFDRINTVSMHEFVGVFDQLYQ